MNFNTQLFSRIVILITTTFLMIGSLFMSVAPAIANTITIKMGSDDGALIFAPREFTVKSGDRIKWVNNKLAPHNVIFKGEEVKSMSHPQLLFSPGDSFETLVPNGIKGDYDFYCAPHRGAGMTGKMTVN
jgi:plastocyanin